ncbi:hypothetical protein FTUN_3959 [Frigoriglobus tundricola]|uniref:Uncharacterized protein n=1 Tax=Frigoriglobus tundricola TaxID=2774151 RepID=A0A6M5YTZ4_9BACT|nr:hypothetical protein FTUN_3959 [Frigoriglobus tundricola]
MTGASSSPNDALIKYPERVGAESYFGTGTTVKSSPENCGTRVRASLIAAPHCGAPWPALSIDEKRM